MPGYERRLPIYLLLDCSESMAGEPIAAVRNGLATLLLDLRSNPLALETVALSVITFASTARQVMPLTDVIKFQAPTLKLGSGTALGAALELWLQCMEREVVKTSAEQKGDYKPVCFILTDGDPTDAWEAVADRVRTSIVGKRANVIGAICGSDGDINNLKRVTGTVIDLKDVSAGTFKQFFKWVSASVSTASAQIDSAGHLGVALPALPIDILAAGERARVGNHYVFLHARCVKKRAFYLMRFGRTTETSPYTAMASHPVADFELDEGSGMKISSNLLQGVTPCPYCGNADWAMCTCGRVHCYPDNQGSITLTCPWCDDTDTYGPASFDVGSGAG